MSKLIIDKLKLKIGVDLRYHSTLLIDSLPVYKSQIKYLLVENLMPKMYKTSLPLLAF